MADQLQAEFPRPTPVIQGEWMVDAGDLGDLRRRMPESGLVGGVDGNHRRVLVSIAESRQGRGLAEDDPL
ncbi:hypothetical protein ABT337_12500 [Saccharopolyspora hirsuta]|uniref:Uncharacterized protein n=2 Tax=Saccharopolyspora hirsuta TaxID=1837 RepID=A0A5M7BZV0_SACHI|nr:hypothetical protein F1721_17580 [Saccharopolyspora hirsuta]